MPLWAFFVLKEKYLTARDFGWIPAQPLNARFGVYPAIVLRRLSLSFALIFLQGKIKKDLCRYLYAHLANN